MTTTKKHTLLLEQDGEREAIFTLDCSGIDDLIRQIIRDNLGELNEYSAQFSEMFPIYQTLYALAMGDYSVTDMGDELFVIVKLA